MINEAKQLLDDGNLSGATEAALKMVKANPTDISARTFLFELACFSGDWTRAERQLDAVGHQDVNAAVGSLIYRQCIEVEKRREHLFSDGVAPEFIVPPPQYVMELLYAVNRIREGNIAEAREVLDNVEEERPAFTCRVNGTEFSDFRDYNDLTAPILEVIIKDSYIWLPFEQIEKITIFEPKTLRDLMWLQGKIETTNGTNGEVMIPGLYSGSYRSPDDGVKLGRVTDWVDLGNELFVGQGLKSFWMDGEARTILEIREIEFLRTES
jgi:type VI secretion system protein ImpE